jgi:hypothetical protein
VSSDLKQDILDSIEDIEELFSSYDVLFMCVNQRDPDSIELAALGTVLHSFYNGIEGIFLLIAKQIDGEVPNESAWHQVLMNRMTMPATKRPAVISSQAADQLASYMKFRHYFRHAYAFMLDWTRMKQLVKDLPSVWTAFKDEVTVFAETL